MRFVVLGVMLGGATWVVVGYLGASVVLNALSRSRLERAVMTPTCAVLAAAALVVALTS